MRLPFPTTDDPLRLADWCELDAILQRDRTSSQGDLEEGLSLSGLLGDDRQLVESLAIDVYLELANRVDAAGSAYPFELKGRVLRLRGALDDYAGYVFCLCLSYFGHKVTKGELMFPRRMFENLCCVAAKNFVGGDVTRFAFPRDAVSSHLRAVVEELPTSFQGALREMCRLIGEGEYRDRPTQGGLDRKLDVVAWRHFEDRLPGKLLLFGQCASGNDWENKVYELNPDAVCKSWMRTQPISPIIKGFFIPHRIAPERWEDMSRLAGVIFDRCRIAFWLAGPTPVGASRPYTAWARAAIAKGCV